MFSDNEIDILTSFRKLPFIWKPIRSSLNIRVVEINVTLRPL